MASKIIFSLAFLLVSTQLLLIQADITIPLEHLEDCIKEVGFNGDIKKLKIEDSDFPHEAKCALACTFRKHNVLKSDGSVDKEGAISFMEKTTKPEERNKIVDQLVHCIKTGKTLPDECETVYNHVKCVMEHESK